MVDAVGVVPEDPEIGSGCLHRSEPVDRPVAVADSLRVGVKRNAPDPLDRIIFRDQLFDQVHVRPLVSHRDGDHLNAEILADCKMAVISRTRTEKLDLRQTAPRRIAPGAEEQQPDHRVVHQVQTGVSADHDVFNRNSQQTAKELASLGDPLQTAVITGVDAVLGPIIRERIQDPVGQVQLAAGGFSADMSNLRRRATLR